MFWICFICYTLLVINLLCTTYIKKYKKYYTLAKLLNSLGFVCIASIGGLYLTKNYTEYFYLLPAFILCLMGDVFLGINTQTSKQSYMLCGIFSFMLAHVVYTFAFSVNILPISVYDFIIPLLSLIMVYFLLKMKDMDVPKDMVKFIYIYDFFVVLLVAKGINIVFFNGFTTKYILILVGSIMFFLSDFIILFLYYYKKKHHLVGTVNLLLYYYGLFLLALSLWEV